MCAVLRLLAILCFCRVCHTGRRLATVPLGETRAPVTCIFQAATLTRDDTQLPLFLDLVGCTFLILIKTVGERLLETGRGHVLNRLQRIIAEIYNVIIG